MCRLLKGSVRMGEKETNMNYNQHDNIVREYQAGETKCRWWFPKDIRRTKGTLFA